MTSKKTLSISNYQERIDKLTVIIYLLLIIMIALSIVLVIKVHQ